jgi:heptosyltransferase-3
LPTGGGCANNMAAVIICDVKILLISLAGIGDTLFATPLLRELRANFPDAVIDVLARWSGSRQVLEGNPHVRTVYQEDLAQVSNSELLRFISPLRKNRYDISINSYPQSRREYRLVARCIGARTRLSHTYECSGWLDHFLVNKTAPQDYGKHCVENSLALLELLGARPQLAEHRCELFLTDAEERWAADYVAQHGLARRRVLGLHVGSGGTKNLPLRRWPVSNYVEVIRQLNRSRPDVPVLLFGGSEETQANLEILRQTNSPLVSQPDCKNIRQAAALLKHCHAFLSVDTALMHLAGMAGVSKQIVIETPTFNKTVEPYRQPFRLVPNPTVAGRNLDYYRYDGGHIKGTPAELRRCMESVTVDAVYAAVAESI